MLSKRQADTFQAIKAYQAEHGICPTVREVAEIIQTAAPSNAYRHLTHLKAKGYIDWEPLKPRTIRVLAYTTKSGLELGLKLPKGITNGLQK